MRSFPIELTAKVKESLQTLGNASQPKLKIAVSRAKTTVTDSNYWTVETIREKAGLGDISVAPRRLYKNYGGPDRLYEIHVDNGEVLTSLREYPDKLKQGWQPQFSLGLGSAVAIAFDGEWELYRKVWRLRTHEVPWIFWVNNLGELYAQLWNDEDTRVQLASGVDGSKGVKAIRGWDNINITAQDQGIVVAYIKAGRPYYRTYAYQINETRVWEIERELTGFVGTAVSTGLFLTNDYRLGILVESVSGIITWMVTGRNWAGLALIPDHITVNANVEVDFIPISYYQAFETEQILISASADVKYLYADDFNEFTLVQNIDNGSGDFGKIIQFRTSHDIFDFTTSEFEIYDDKGMPYAPLTINENNGLFTLTFEDFNNFKNSILLKAKAVELKNEAGYLYSSFEKSFLPVNLLPTETPLPEVLEVWNE